MGYKFCEARRKGILSSADHAKRVKFAREVQTTFEDNFWKHKVCFYLDGVSFWYKKNPVDDARSPHSKMWRKRNEGLDQTNNWMAPMPPLTMTWIFSLYFTNRESVTVPSILLSPPCPRLLYQLIGQLLENTP